MTRFSILLIILLVFVKMAYAIPAPPPLADSPQALQAYLQILYDNFNQIPVTTTDPNGTRNGQKGDMLLLKTGGENYLQINVDSSTTWSGVFLKDIP